jgi:hypothetical protein
MTVETAAQLVNVDPQAARRLLSVLLEQIDVAVDEVRQLARTQRRAWIDEAGRPWPVIRRKVRFVGVTSRTKTSPNTYRWQQHATWTRQLPSRAVLNVSLHPVVWSYFGDHQVKLTRSHRPERWLADADGPDRDEHTRQALAEAAALVAYGRSRAGRRALATAVGREPALAQPWLRSIVTNGT